MIEIRHRNGFVTRYGHLRALRLGRSCRAHVSIGQTIAFVGMTGLATGPHLHFEVLVNGEQRDPRTALKQTGGDPIPRRSAPRSAVARPASRVARHVAPGVPGSARPDLRRRFAA